MIARLNRNRRKGMGTVEWVVVASAILLGVILMVSTMGRRVDTKLDSTIDGTADPASLTHQFGD